MTTALLKKITTTSQEQGTTEELLAIVDALIMLKKKLGKQLSQSAVLDMLQSQFAQVYELYELLGGSKVSLKKYRLLKQYLTQSLGGEHLHAIVSHDRDIAGVDAQYVAGSITNPSLIVTSSDKIYRRSLQDDLTKLVQL